jgi:3-oxoadipate enol-lactonase
VAGLAEHFRVVRYDTRGHGSSPAPQGPYSIDDLADDLLALFDRLGVERAHVVGLSLGGMTAMRLAARHPERVDRLVVLCTSALLGPAQGWLDRAATVRARGTAAVAAPVVERWYTPAYAQAHPERVAAAQAMVAAQSPEGYASCCDAIAAMDLTEDLPDISAPTLAVAGADDLATPPEHLERIAGSVKDGRLLVVPQAAHIASQEQPEAVTRAVLEHLTAR